MGDFVIIVDLVYVSYKKKPPLEKNKSFLCAVSTKMILCKLFSFYVLYIGYISLEKSFSSCWIVSPDKPVIVAIFSIESPNESSILAVSNFS